MDEIATGSDLPRPKAYSYLRFSTEEQGEGDSLRRQTTLASRYAAKRGLDLDLELTYQDLGVSAYRGLNAAGGRLADFQEAVKVGAVKPGSYLLVESLDRISRNHAIFALNLLNQIVLSGVSVVTLLDEQEYSIERLQRDPMGLMYALMGFIRANEESATKSRRLSEAWAEKRSKIGIKPLTSKAPAWLEFNASTKRFMLIPARAAIVQRIFAMTLNGVGQHKIAETFNREGLAPWGSAKHWKRSYIAKVLSNPAVVGTIIPHRVEHSGSKKRRVPLEPVLDYYPAAISPETWADVQALTTAQVATTKTAPLSNILAGLAKCPKCGATMTRVQKGSSAKSGFAAFVCTRAKVRAGCQYKSVRYQWIEDRLLLVLPDMIRDREGLDEVEEVEDRVGELYELISQRREQIGQAIDALLEVKSAALAERLRWLEADTEAMESELSALEAHREVMAGPLVASRIEKAIRALEPAGDSGLDRAAANVALRSLFKQAIINWPEGTIDLEWKAGGSCRVIYAMNPNLMTDASPEGASVCTEERNDD